VVLAITRGKVVKPEFHHCHMQQVGGADGLG
jgi:hypothetical protein